MHTQGVLVALLATTIFLGGCAGPWAPEQAAVPSQETDPGFEDIAHEIESATAVRIKWTAVGDISASWVTWDGENLTANQTDRIPGQGNHEATLTGLLPNATYTYAVAGLAGDGDILSEARQFVTPMLPPAAWNVTVTDIQPSSARLLWNASGYGAISSAVEITPANQSAVRGIIVDGARSSAGSWSANASGLKAATSYVAIVVVLQEDGQEAVSEVVPFTTPEVVPVVMALEPTMVTITQARVNWFAQGPEGSVAWVIYGQTHGTLMNATAPAEPDAAGVVLTKLMPNQTYYYQIILEDPDGVRFSSEIQNLTTLEPPVSVDSVRVANVEHDSVVVQWSAKGSSDGSTALAFYESGSTHPTVVFADGNIPGPQSVGMTGLQPGTTYVYRVQVYFDGDFLYATGYQSVTTQTA